MLLRCCSTPRARASRRPTWVRTASRRHSSSGRCAGPANREPAVVASLRDRIADEYGLLDQWERSAELRERAVRRWRELGNRRRESTALRKLAHARWRLCDGEAYERLVDEAMCGARRTSRRVPSSGGRSTSRRASLTSEQPREARVLAQQAVALAEQFGDTDLLSEALNTEACARLVPRRRGRRPCCVGRSTWRSRGATSARSGEPSATCTASCAAATAGPRPRTCSPRGWRTGSSTDFSTYEACLKGGHIRGARDAGALGRDAAARTRDRHPRTGAPVAGQPARTPCRASDASWPGAAIPRAPRCSTESLALARPLESSDWLTRLAARVARAGLVAGRRGHRAQVRAGGRRAERGDRPRLRR